MAFTTFRAGDRIIHTGKPEWGPGDVLSAVGEVQEGKPCQRLSIRFTRAGLKTISTAFAELRGAPPEGAQAEEETADPPERRLQHLPDEATDPFRSATSRLAATLSLYRYAETPSGLVEWATAQTGMRDPLARFSRHDLELAFERFRITLDNHLKKLLRDARKESPQDTAKLLSQAGRAAKQAVSRVDTGR